MNKLLSFEIKYSSPIPFSLLHNETAAEQFLARPFSKDSQLYFICKVKKVRFDLKSIKVENDIISIDLLYMGKRANVKFCITKGKNIEIRQESNNKVLLLDVEDNDEHNPMYVSPDLILRKLGKNIGNKPEILYVGYSSEPVQRLLSHEKIVKAVANIDDEDELRLYVNSLVFGYCINDDTGLKCINNIGIEQGQIADSQFKDYIKLAERIFIHYFQTESLNEKHIEMNISKDRLFKKILLKNKIRFIGGGYEMEDGEYFDFFSKNISSPNKHFFLDYSNPGDGYLQLEDVMVRL